MNNIFYIDKAGEIMTNDVAARHLDAVFKESSYLDKPVKMTLFGTEPLDNWDTVAYILEYFNYNWFRVFENGEVILITNGRGLDDEKIKLLSRYKEFINVHIIVDDTTIVLQKLISNKIPVTARIIFTEESVLNIYDRLCELTAMDIKSFFLQRVQVKDKAAEKIYYDRFRDQMGKVVGDLLNTRRLSLNIVEQFPMDMNEEQDFYFIFEDMKYLKPDGSVKAFTWSPNQKKDMIVVPVVMTEACNFNCKYCYVSKRNRDDYAAITSEDILLIPGFIEQCLNDYNNVRLDIFGGEPLVCWDKCKELIECLEPVYKKHPKSFSALIFTNGSLLTDKILEYTITKPFVDYHFSLDGNKKSNDNTRQYRNGKHTYDDIQDALGLYNRYYKKNKNSIATQYVISPDNVANFYDSMVYLCGDGYKKVDINVVKENVWTPESLDIYREQYKKVADFIIEKLSNNEVFYIKQMFEPHAYKNVKGKSICSACGAMIGIGADGKIYPCQRFFNNRSGYSIGTLKDGIDRDCVSYRTIAGFPHSHLEKCKGCELEGMCGQHCLCAMYENGDMYEYIDSICEINKYNFKISEYMHTKLRPIELYRNLSDRIFCTKCC